MGKVNCPTQRDPGTLVGKRHKGPHRSGPLAKVEQSRRYNQLVSSVLKLMFTLMPDLLAEAIRASK